MVYQTSVKYVNPQWTEIDIDLTKYAHGRESAEQVLESIDRRRAEQANIANDPDGNSKIIVGILKGGRKKGAKRVIIILSKLILHLMFKFDKNKAKKRGKPHFYCGFSLFAGNDNGLVKIIHKVD